ncbi:unnamed protein product [Lactuca virosa]|uniref:RRM domain-containing protein n=1 Tax=Lactuca virosa TaxID=75947 RepID=A0AAU9M6G4_9ASTR|nr:unnamed protein product [Lactuca virosa]
MDGRKYSKHVGVGDGWTEVRRKQYPGDKSKDVTTFYVTNLQADVTVEMIRKSFQSFGKLVDVYIPGRKDKGGTFFAFIRYAGIKDINSLVTTLNQVRCGHSIANVNIARYEKKPPPRQMPPPNSYHPRRVSVPIAKHNNISTGKTFVDAVTGSLGKHDTVRTQEIQLKRAPMIDSCDSSCLIGEVKELRLLNNIHALLNAEESIPSRVHYAGGLKIILRFFQQGKAESFMADSQKWCSWIRWLKIGFVDDQTNGRLARIRILGIPLYLRSDENITAATILTNSWKLVNEEVVTTFNGNRFQVGVSECENKWEPFLDRSFPEAPLSEVSDSEDDDAMNEQGDNSGEDSDDEGISETWINRDMMEGLEDGEINMKGSEAHGIATGIATGDGNQLAEEGESSKGRDEREELNA